MATMMEIARLAGVSRGTVDRVINGRGGVGPETTERILRAAAQLEYSPNKAARALSAGKRNFLIEFILFNPGKAHYYLDIRQGALSAVEELQASDVILKFRYLENWSEQEILTRLNEAVADGASGIAVFATSDPAVVERIREITDAGIPVMTVGSEIPECGQLGFVGSNAYRAGRTAAGLIHLIQRQEIHLGVILGFRSRFYHNRRLTGLTAGLEEQGRPWSLSFVECSNDDEFDCFDIVKEQMLLHPEVNTLFLSTSSSYGACRALERLKLPKLPKVVCYDKTPGIREMLQKGVISATIGQEPVRQGRKAVLMLFDYLAFGAVPREKKIYTENKIIIQENL
ncbi:MAG: LacI family DNA-binding transcriptional regulator [Candidatus Faecousia sp.]|nr:LacI family DNA-binding transcriptional regulator [Candidatus Faecousia sp.]